MCHYYGIVPFDDAWLVKHFDTVQFAKESLSLYAAFYYCFVNGCYCCRYSIYCRLCVCINLLPSVCLYQSIAVCVSVYRVVCCDKILTFHKLLIQDSMQNAFIFWIMSSADSTVAISNVWATLFFDCCKLCVVRCRFVLISTFIYLPPC